MAFTGCSPTHTSAPTPSSPSAIADAPASLPISADVNLLPYGKGRLEEFRNPKYLVATEGCIHASAAISLSEGSTISLTLESDCPIDWYGDWDNPRPQIGIIFPQMITYIEDSGWVTICSGAMETRHIVSSSADKRLEVILTIHPNNSGASIPNIYKLYAINLDPSRPHYLKYNISSYSGESSHGAFLTAPELVTPPNGATGIGLRPVLLWEPVPNAKGYEVTISLNYDFSEVVRDASTRLTAYQITEDLMPSTRYYWMVAAKMNPADPDTPIAWSPVWKFTTATAPAPAPPLEVPAPSPPPEPTIDDVFLSRWGHTYYNNSPRVSYDLDQIEKLLIEIVCQVPWRSYYKAGVFDCSEKSAYLEYVFERHGYTAEIAEGEGHAWVLVYNDVASCWLPIDATLPVGTLTPPHPYTPTIGGIVECHFTLQWRWEDIYHVKRISEYDWWNSPYADELVAASDRVRLP